ncbi:IS200/IS605 family accessory protein TnpB-related protein, partial [Halolactibacillus sp. JCM 19043]|uniref:IS200/IS605 family accessory protein TnpB-related protein n=1 Tax=Halolactibacillus sp. JCM 19043 TaxID=1460638 RepID=UPI0018D12F33
YGKPIAWSLEDHGDYYIVKCLIDVPPAPYLNTSTSTGMIGVDLNVNHIAVANVNAIGQCVDAFTLPFNLEGKTSGQQAKIIEAEVIALVDYAVKQHKPLAIEKLDTTRSKVSRPYGNKKANRRMSQFAYQKMILAIKSRAEKMGVAVYVVNPAYTSQIGKMKYMKRSVCPFTWQPLMSLPDGQWDLKKNSHRYCIHLFQSRNKVYIIGRNGRI